MVTLRLLLVRVLVALAFVLSIAAFGQTAAGGSSTKTYTDAAHGVSFQYPSVWTESPKTSLYFAPAITQDHPATEVHLDFTTQGTLYEKTILRGLEFSYIALPTADKATCLAIGKDNATSTRLERVNGIVFQHTAGSDGGMSKQAIENFYATYRSGTCLLFEGDMLTISPGVEDGTRSLRPAEIKALKRHLREVMQSVRVTLPE